MNRQSQIRRNTDQWQAIILQYNQSGQTLSEFCAAQSLVLSTFHRCYQRLGTSSQQHDSVGEEPLFFELASEDEAITLPTPIPWDVELQLGEDIVLRLRRQCCVSPRVVESGCVPAQPICVDPSMACLPKFIVI